MNKCIPNNVNPVTLINFLYCVEIWELRCFEIDNKACLSFYKKLI